MENYVLITGASSGLGADFARQYAAQGKNLILAARRIDRMELLKEEIQSKYDVVIEVIQADLADPLQRRQVIDTWLGKVDILVNNAGFGIGGAFDTVDYAKIQNLIDVNISALSEFCHAFGNDMKARRHGTIINIASMAAFTAGPYMAAYYASKAYVLSLSEALHEECLPFGVKVVAVCPGPTLTEFFKASGSSAKPSLPIFLMRSEQVVTLAIRDAEKNKAIAISGFRNQLVHLFLTLFGRRAGRKSVARIKGSDE
ncbi:MAG: SDR family oxidoreductase [Erysipelotrichaceae bacterium]